MSTNLQDNFSLSARLPLDAKLQVSTREALSNILNPYAGMLVFIQDLKKVVLVKLLEKVGLTYKIKLSSVLDVATGSNSLSWGKISNKPTTIGGYGITDAYINIDRVILGSNSLTVQRHWFGTPQEYRDIAVKDPLTLYSIYGSDSLVASIDYSSLQNKPRINGYLLLNNKSSLQLNLASILSIPRVDFDTRVISLQSNSLTIPQLYLLPRASVVNLGGIFVGSNLAIDLNGVLSGNYQTATTVTDGLLSYTDKLKLNSLTKVPTITLLQEVSETYRADFSVADIHRIQPKANTTCVLSVDNIPLGGLLTLYVDNTNGGIVVYNNDTIVLLYLIGDYIINFINYNNSIKLCGGKAEAR